MAYQVLARKYRPQRFSDVAGQDHVTVTLMNALTQGRIAHGYIFSGHRGIGKTTVARILASALNCRNPIGSELRPTAEPCEVCESCLEIRAGNAVDVIEIDAATNRGIDEIRELRDAARYRPARDKFKIYILDEAHQITDAAFNALLKTLEEPPDHIVFMMATTQPEDIPQTVRSRCQHFSFHAVKLVDILSELRGIAARENVDADEAALNLLAEAGDGSMRDALSIMDQAIASAPVEDGKPILDASQIRELMGTVPNAVFERVLEAVNNNSSAEVITVVNQLLDSGNSPAQLARQFVRYLRNCAIAKIANVSPNAASLDGTSAELLQISPDEQRRAARSAALFTEEELTRFLQVMLRTFDELGYRQEQRFHFELGLIKLVHLRRLLPIEELLSQLPTAKAPSANPSRASLGTTSVPRPTPPQATFSSRPSAAPVPVASSKPVFSPFESDTTRKRVDTPPAPSFPAPAPESPAAPLVTISSSSVGNDTAATPSVQVLDLDLDDLKNQTIRALSNLRNQASAADAIADSIWSLAEDELRIQTEVSKAMLPMILNPEADKLLRATLRDLLPTSTKVTFLPGAANPAAAKKIRPARSGSAQSKAMEHPIVQQAQRLFNAEIRTVIDLTEGN